MNLFYTINVEPDDNDTQLITCVELPEVTSFAEPNDDLGQRALDALEDALAYRIKTFEDIPEGKATAETGISPSLRTQFLISIQEGMKENEMTRADLMRALDMKRTSVDRIFTSSVKLDTIERTFKAIGIRPFIKCRAIDTSAGVHTWRIENAKGRGGHYVAHSGKGIGNKGISRKHPTHSVEGIHTSAGKILTDKSKKAKAGFKRA